MINELISLVGAPSYLLIFIEFLWEIELSKLWIRRNQEGHPHDYITEVPLQREPNFRSMDLFAVRAHMSPAFSGWSDAFGVVLRKMMESCREPCQYQLFRYLCD